MNPKWLHLAFPILFPCLILPVDGHVPISAENNYNVNAALSIEKTLQSYVIYGHLHDAGDVGYFRFIMSPDRPGPYVTGFSAGIFLTFFLPWYTNHAGYLGADSCPFNNPLFY